MPKLTPGPLRAVAVLWVVAAALAVPVAARSQQSHAPVSEAQPAKPEQAKPEAASIQNTIQGSVHAGATPLPGVAITATNTLTGKKFATTTDITGAFTMTIPRNGRYVVRTELVGFAPATQEVLLNAAGENGGKPTQTASFTLQLASQLASQQTAASTVSTASLARGLQSLSLQLGSADSSDATGASGVAGAQMPSIGGTGADAPANDSVNITGALGQTNGLANVSEDEIRQRIEDAVARAKQQGGATGDLANAVVGMLGGMMGGGPGGGLGGGPGGGFGGGRGGGAFRRFNPSQPHGSIFYQGGNGALNATNYSLTGAPTPKPGYSSNRYGLSFVGSPYIPGLLKPRTKDFVFLSVTGQRTINPLNLYGTVPTLAERTGDFSALTQRIGQNQVPVTLYDPQTGQPIPGNNFANANLAVTQQAAAILAYYPAPNLTSFGPEGYNYQTITTAGANNSAAAARYVHNFGATPTGFGGPRQLRQSGPATLTQNVNFSGSYTHTANDNRNLFLPLGGAAETNGYGVTAGYTIGYGHFNSNASVNWNRLHTKGRNYFTDSAADPLATTGINIPKPVVGAAPGIYYGLPSLSFTGFTALTNAQPSDVLNQTISFSDFLAYSHKKHNLRFGFDIRRVHADSIAGTNALGAFSFTGYATQNPACATANCPQQKPTGSGFADFLLGLPQQSSIQAGLYKAYLRANVFDWYLQDDWRARPALTLNYGLRYEYFSPYVEKYDRLVNLDHTANFSSVAAVEPNQTGPYSGQYPRSLVNPDRLLYSPRVGFAYRVKRLKDTVIRGGYGINFNTGQYATTARQLSFQPPFAVTQTNIVGQQGCGTLTLASGYGCSTAPVENNYSANRNYRLGHVQVYNLDVQHTFPLGIVTNLGWNGSKGGELDIVRAPNRTAVGLLNPNAQAFNYEDSLGYSRFNALTLNVRKRLQKGIALQATYIYGHSIDDASSIGGSTTVVAQNDQNLNAEEGNSSFDIRQRVSGNWVFELPFGPNRALLSTGGFWSRALDGFSVSGDYTFATGTYFTPNYVGTVQEAATGANGSLRPDRNFSAPISGQQTVFHWFNPAAFTAPAPGTYGTASRNSIEGPGTVSIDGSLSRTIQFGSTRSFEARITASNVLNTVQYSAIDTTLNSPTFGQVTATANQRQILLIGRYRF